MGAEALDENKNNFGMNRKTVDAEKRNLYMYQDDENFWSRFVQIVSSSLTPAPSEGPSPAFSPAPSQAPSRAQSPAPSQAPSQAPTSICFADVSFQ
jgi:hypothetical protein